MNTKLDKEFENIGFILDKSQFETYNKIYKTCSFEECILNCVFHGFEQIDFSKKDYLKSEYYKLGNIFFNSI